ncbi:hypothetical protein BCR33DRAFT_721716 [Rhizoclosmatium globosum]|uniref:RING-CH-type domain-containing protein n=1 Tax=Rhizoclosmatium globosum TaxID=329046 RepID=A0A1Y2BQR9_9FUNG|nr:hypothetical protein BCR33DRAFT_721716 [Rhizoclosmatium globosum]|eukprot:ORY37084.1 hypothetical protein BCR33DRAFT_721716 [Rhizoclosmatium globosum]
MSLATTLPPELTKEQEHQLAPQKGKCWCCWETAETPHDPLIRVCRGCKDPDLQYIHQTCINKYLSKLPVTSTPAFTPPRQQQRRNLVMRLLMDPPDAQMPPIAKPTDMFRCTRCRDLYKVTETPVPLITCVWKDAYLRGAVLVLVGSTTFVLLAVVYCLYQERWVAGRKLVIDFGGGGFGGGFRVSLDVTLFAGSMLAVCYFMCWSMFQLLKEYFRGEVERFVKAV